jgi:nucleoid-associated protein YgaU
MMRPKLVAAVLAGGIVVLGVGSAVAASLPSPSRPERTAATGTPTGTPTVGTVPQPAKSRAASSVTYTVKAGDTLSGIAEWFKLHGYGVLYAANEAVIGSNPNLIVPGERITITKGVMKLNSAP